MCIRDSSECLLLQLAQGKHFTEENIHLLRSGLPLLAEEDWDGLARLLGVSREQAKRDAVLAFRQEVQQEFEKILAADVGKALDQQTLAKLIQAALQGEDVSGYAVEVGQVTDGIRQQLAQELKNGLELRPSKKVGAGFRLAAKDGSGYFDCSDQEIAEMLMPFFRDMHL